MIQGLSVLAVIAARGGSKGLPRKNVLPVGGKPLIAWTIEAARAARHVDRVVLSSDDAEIIAVAKEHDCDVPFVRSAALASDTASSVDVVLDAIERVPGFDIVVLLQPTSPLRSASDIDCTISRLVASGAPCCVTLRPASDHPYWTFRIDATGRLAGFCVPAEALPVRRQDLPPAWCLNGAVYAARTEWFLRTRTFLSGDTVGFEMPAERSIDIDTPADFEFLRSVLEKSDLASGPSFNLSKVVP